MPELSLALPIGRRTVTAAALVLVLAGCGSAAATPTPAASGAPSNPPTSAPSSTPAATVAGIDHRTGATDVILRLEEGGGFVPIDFLASQAPSFTLYGDGVVVFQPRVETFPQPDASGVVHGVPWRTAKLDEGQIQELLEAALGPGGLGAARESYIDGGIADAGNSIFTIRAGGVDKSVTINALSDASQGPDAPARAAFWKLAERLRDFDRGGSVATDVFQSDRYRGVLIEREPQAGPGATKWPWTTIKLADFQAEALPDGGTSFPRRTLSPDDVGALKIADFGGGLQNIVVAGSDGKSYTLVVRPLLADEPS
jgi:hypothetical protein